MEYRLQGICHECRATDCGGAPFAMWLRHSSSQAVAADSRFRKGPAMIIRSKTLVLSFLLVTSVACANTARGVVQDTKDNTSAVRGGLETIDVKSAIIADKTIDSGAIDVDT